jgi:hypothetical protein
MVLQGVWVGGGDAMGGVVVVERSHHEEEEGRTERRHPVSRSHDHATGRTLGRPYHLILCGHSR